MSRKKVFITGGTSGFGLELAKVYADYGAIVGVCGRDKSKFQEIDNIHFYCADVSCEESLKSVVDQFVIISGGLDIMVANAGIAYAHKNKFPDFEYSKKMLDINVNGFFYTFKIAAEIMLKQKSGQLVGVSSVAGYNGLPGVSFYAGSKSLVMKVCESFSLDLKEFGIYTSCIIPGFMDTPLTRVNPHPMPFLMKSEDAALKAYKAIGKRKELIYFPWQMVLLTKLLSMIPRKIYRMLFGIKIFNFSKDKK
jgi:short-subunit dehydrogenase